MVFVPAKDAAGALVLSDAGRAARLAWGNWSRPREPTSSARLTCFSWGVNRQATPAPHVLESNAALIPTFAALL